MLLFTMEKMIVKMRGQEEKENDGKSEASAKMVFKSLKGRVKVKKNNGYKS